MRALNQTQVFGDKSSFAIEFTPSLESPFPKYGYVRLWLGQKPIINEDEVCYLPSFRSSIKYVLDKILLNPTTFHTSRFEGKSAQEIYKMLMQGRSIVNAKWTMGTPNPILGGLDDSVYFKHLLRLDETIDPYYIFLLSDEQSLTVLWKCADKHNCSPQEFGKLFAQTVPILYFSQVLKDFLTFFDS
ncbi:hypothetical protein LRS06_15985 [Hymenobacter sp. J193]|uniref:hypothetical protein n=1 Tax=Hymenobacter sp. J193 TaxID=2898429 RepID=UPI002150F47F|nr:hypothetical protein [Hymenobacter sp. J193]MCR5889237.1 hypothetical protein [Hymenobacter sp. J193]